MTITIKKSTFYMVTLRNNSFRAIIGDRIVELLKAQRERQQLYNKEFASDIISAIELPNGYIEGDVQCLKK